jgi:hypothetical protein
MAMYIDNVVVREKSSCDYMDVKVDSIKTTVARVTTLTSDVDQWQVSVGAPGFNPNSGTLFDATGTSVTISGLTPETDYELYARRKCLDGTYGPWSEFVLKFSTQCEPLVVDFNNPFFEGFENFTVDEYVFGKYDNLALCTLNDGGDTIVSGTRLPITSKIKLVISKNDTTLFDSEQLPEEKIFQEEVVEEEHFF